MEKIIKKINIYNSKKYLLFILLLTFHLEIVGVSASVTSLMDQAGRAALYDTSKTNPAEIVGGVLNLFLTLLGSIAIILIVYAGYLWMTAKGESEQVTKAKDLLKDAIIGLIIVISAYAITYFVLFYLAKNYIKGGGGFK